MRDGRITVIMVFGRKGTNTVSARTANCPNSALWPTVNSHWYASRQPQTSHETALRWLGTFELYSQEHQTWHETAFGWLRTSGLASQEHQTSRTSEPASTEPRTSHETGGECVTGVLLYGVWEEGNQHRFCQNCQLSKFHTVATCQVSLVELTVHFKKQRP